MNTSLTINNLRVADLKLFISAAQMQNLSKSASMHHLSQSAASTAIQRVEAAFGLSLCTHEKRRFQLTREGESLLPKVEAWLQNLDDILLDQEKIPIRIATTHAIAQVLLPQVMSVETVEIKLMRPDAAYTAVLHGEADLALVLDNAAWKGLISTEVFQGTFQIYAQNREAPLAPILLPEEQIEVLTLQERWIQAHAAPLPIKARIPSWSLIADICSHSEEIGFLPDFLAEKNDLVPVSWQPEPVVYRLLALQLKNKSERISNIVKILLS